MKLLIQSLIEAIPRLGTW